MLFELLIGNPPKTKIFHPGYLHMKPLEQYLSREFDKIGVAEVILDVGGAEAPYKTLAHYKSYLCTDIYPGDHVNIVCKAENLKVPDNSVDVVLCTQVLEHVDNPQKCILEFSRVLKQDGVVLLSTHGTTQYHPCPEDYWRWTYAGLNKLFVDNGFNNVKILPLGTSVDGVFSTAISLAYESKIKYFYSLVIGILNITSTLLNPLFGLFRPILPYYYFYMLSPAFLVIAKK